jgi:hypothetical protein
MYVWQTGDEKNRMQKAILKNPYDRKEASHCRNNLNTFEVKVFLVIIFEDHVVESYLNYNFHSDTQTPEFLVK